MNPSLDNIGIDRKAAHILLIAATALYVITGLGITNYQLVGPLTLGILTKALSQQIHSLLLAPFLILLALHIYFVFARKREN